jgi:signal recognition particle subunit SRP54
LGQIGKLGPINKIMSMIPGMGGMSKMLEGQNPEADMRRLVGIIDSMTPDERRNPSKTVDQSRRRRIAAGAGVEAHEVNELVKQFDGMADIMKKMSNMGMMERMKTMHQLSSSGMLNPNTQFAKPNKGTGKRLTSAERAKLKKQREKELRRRKRKDK